MYVGAKQGLIVYFDRSQLPEYNKSLPQPAIAPLPVLIYFFREERAFEVNFLFDASLIKADTPKHYPNPIGTDFYALAEGGVYVSRHVDIKWSIEHMERHGLLNTFFKLPAPLPKPRWSDLELHEVPIPKAAEAYRAKLEELCGRGGVYLKRYEAESFRAFEACRRVQELSTWTTFQTELLRHPVFLSLPVFEEPDFNLVADGEWFMGGGFHIEAFLASDLRRGGPYRRADAQTSLNLANAARESLWGDRYDDLWLYYLNHRPTGVGQWSRWFCDLIWDRTMIVVERSEERNLATITCLFATSTD